MKDAHIPVNERERVSQRGFRLRNPKLVALAHPDEWRSIKPTGETIEHE